MDYTELQAALITDTHKENYATEIPRYIAQGESYIRARLEAYGLSTVLTDADRVVSDGAVYTLPARVTLVRSLRDGADGRPLVQVDEAFIWTVRAGTAPQWFCLRPSHVIFAGVPAADSQWTLDYLGMPVPLATTPSNTLLDDYPQLYIDAASIYIHKRAQDYESAQVVTGSVNGLIDEINRRLKKQLGGAQASPVYNVGFRSSY